MRTDASIEAEQAVLGALLTDEGAWADVADVFRPELFTLEAHQEIAREVQALAREQKPADPILVSQRLDARKVLGSAVPHELPLSLGRAIGSASSVRHYVGVLESLWAKREAKRVAGEMLRLDVDVSGEEFVGRFAERLSAIETKHNRSARKLAEVMYGRLERREAIQKDPSLVKAWPTGFAVLDSLTGGLKPGHLFTLAASPGVGKTALMTSMLKTLARKRVPTGIFMLEDYEDAVADRTLMREGQIGSTFMRDTIPWGKETWTRAVKAVDSAKDWPIYVDDQHGRTIHEIAGAMRRMARENGIKVFFLDNLAEVVIDQGERGDERLDRALGRISKTYRDTAKALDAAPVLIVHINREAAKAERKPRMSDIKNSGELEDASHVVAMLSREQDSELLMVDVVKNRNGPPGECALHYDKQFMEVRNPEGGGK